MHPTEVAAGGALISIGVAVGLTLAFVYLLAPFVLYGIYSRLGRLIQLQEYALTRGAPNPEQYQPEPEAAAQWSKL